MQKFGSGVHVATGNEVKMYTIEHKLRRSEWREKATLKAPVEAEDTGSPQKLLLFNLVLFSLALHTPLSPTAPTTPETADQAM